MKIVLIRHSNTSEGIVQLNIIISKQITLPIELSV